MSVRVTKDFTKKLMKILIMAGKKQVLVGIPEDKNSRTGEAIGNAYLGAIHEYGSPARNIPARPFLNPGVKDAQKDTIKILKFGAKSALDNFNVAAIEQSLNRVGLNAQAVVKKRITGQVGFEALKPATIKARERTGRKGTKALIRTGELLNSVTYVLRDK